MKEKLEIEWRGQKATITDKEVFEVADAIEQFMTVGELAVMRSQPGRIRYAQLSRAYSAVLNTMGIPAKPREVHNDFTAVMRSVEKQNRLEEAVKVMDWLLFILMDGAPEMEADEKKDAEKEVVSGK